MFLVQCPKCNKIYKCHKEQNKYVTDFGDDVTNYCLTCNQDINPDVMEVVDWIADLVFIVKGK